MNPTTPGNTLTNPGTTTTSIFQDASTSTLQSVRFGQDAGKVSSGVGNAFVGYQAAQNMQTGDYVTAIGYQAGNSAFLKMVPPSPGTYASGTFVGAYAGAQNNGIENVFVGYSSGDLSTEGNQLVGIGAYSLRSNTSGNSTVAIGYYAGEKTLDGGYNTIIGAQAGQDNRSGNFNTMAGFQSGRSAFLGNENTYFGAFSGYSNSHGSANCFIGYKTGFGLSYGDMNIAIGAYAMQGVTGGSSNVVIGPFAQSGSNIGGGNLNTILGVNAGPNNSGNCNTLIGANIAPLLQNGNNNTLLGANTGQSLTNGDYNILIGTGADVFYASTSNAISIGSSNTYSANHDISIGEEIRNEGYYSTDVGHNITSTSSKLIAIGNDLNVYDQKIFNDFLFEASILDSAADGLRKFGICNINYTNTLIGINGTVYPNAEAKYTTNYANNPYSTNNSGTDSVKNPYIITNTQLDLLYNISSNIAIITNTKNTSNSWAINHGLFIAQYVPDLVTSIAPNYTTSTFTNLIGTENKNNINTINTVVDNIFKQQSNINISQTSIPSTISFDLSSFIYNTYKYNININSLIQTDINTINSNTYNYFPIPYFINDSNNSNQYINTVFANTYATSFVDNVATLNLSGSNFILNLNQPDQYIGFNTFPMTITYCNTQLLITNFVKVTECNYNYNNNNTINTNINYPINIYKFILPPYVLPVMTSNSHSNLSLNISINQSIINPSTNNPYQVSLYDTCNIANNTLFDWTINYPYNYGNFDNTTKLGIDITSGIYNDYDQVYYVNTLPSFGYLASLLYYNNSILYNLPTLIYNDLNNSSNINQIAISGDGYTFVASYTNIAQPLSNHFSIYTYTSSNTSWSLTTLPNSPLPPIGQTLSISYDGSTVLVGSPTYSNIKQNITTGYAAIYSNININQNEKQWIICSNITTSSNIYPDIINFGKSVAISQDGNTALIGANSSNNTYGYVLQFKKTLNIWQFNNILSNSLPPSNHYFTSNFGNTLTLSENGNIALVSSANYNSNITYGYNAIYNNVNNNWYGPQSLSNTFQYSNLNLNTSVSLSGTGNTALIGEYNNNNYYGYAAIYTNINSSYVLQQELFNYAIDPYYSNVVLLLNQYTTVTPYITDNSIYNTTLSNKLTSNVSYYQYVTTTKTQYNYGSTSLYFGGNAYLQTSNIVNINNGNDFTIELWSYNINNSVITNNIICGANSNNNGWVMYYNSSTNCNNIQIYSSSLQQVILSSPVGSYNSLQWNHIAFTRSNTKSYLFVNGSNSPNGITTQHYNSTSSFYIGWSGYSNDTSGWYGYMDDFRVTLGICRYTSTTPSSNIKPTSTYQLLKYNGFGISTVLSTDGNTAIIGTNNGYIIIYTYNYNTQKWIQLKELNGYNISSNQSSTNQYLLTLNNENILYYIDNNNAIAAYSVNSHNNYNNTNILTYNINNRNDVTYIPYIESANISSVDSLTIQPIAQIYEYNSNIYAVPSVSNIPIYIQSSVSNLLPQNINILSRPTKIFSQSRTIPLQNTLTTPPSILSNTLAIPFTSQDIFIAPYLNQSYAGFINIQIISFDQNLILLDTLLQNTIYYTSQQCAYSNKILHTPITFSYLRFTDVYVNLGFSNVATYPSSIVYDPIVYNIVSSIDSTLISTESIQCVYYDEVTLPLENISTTDNTSNALIITQIGNSNTSNLFSSDFKNTLNDNSIINYNGYPYSNHGIIKVDSIITNIQGSPEIFNYGVYIDTSSNNIISQISYNLTSNIRYIPFNPDATTNMFYSIINETEHVQFLYSNIQLNKTILSQQFSLIIKNYIAPFFIPLVADPTITLYNGQSNFYPINKLPLSQGLIDDGYYWADSPLITIPNYLNLNLNITTIYNYPISYKRISSATSYDGYTVFVSTATFTNPFQQNIYTGDIYIYTSNINNGNWNTPIHIASNEIINYPGLIFEDNSASGLNANISGDGKTAIVSVRNNEYFQDPNTGYGCNINSENVYIYTVNNNGVWNKTATFINNTEQSGELPVPSYFGSALALSYDGTTAIVGTQYGQYAIIYTSNIINNTWSAPIQLIRNIYVDGFFGGNVSISYDGYTALVTADGYNNNQGYVAIYTSNISNGTWSSPVPLNNIVASSNIGFGYFAQLSGDGLSAVVTTTYEYADRYSGRAFLYTSNITNDTWNFSYEFINNDQYFANSITINHDGTIISIGSGITHDGLDYYQKYYIIMYIKNTITNVWDSRIIQNNDYYGDYGLIGNAISLSGNGSNIIQTSTLINSYTTSIIYINLFINYSSTYIYGSSNILIPYQKNHPLQSTNLQLYLTNTDPNKLQFFNILDPFTISVYSFANTSPIAFTDDGMTPLPYNVLPIPYAIKCLQAYSTNLNTILNNKIYISNIKTVHNIYFCISQHPNNGVILFIDTGEPATIITYNDIITNRVLYQHTGNTQTLDSFVIKIATTPYDISFNELTVYVIIEPLPYISTNIQDSIYYSTSNDVLSSVHSLKNNLYVTCNSQYLTNNDIYFINNSNLAQDITLVGYTYLSNISVTTYSLYSNIQNTLSCNIINEILITYPNTQLVVPNTILQTNFIDLNLNLNIPSSLYDSIFSTTHIIQLPTYGLSNFFILTNTPSFTYSNIIIPCSYFQSNVSINDDPYISMFLTPSLINTYSNIYCNIHNTLPNVTNIPLNILFNTYGTNYYNITYEVLSNILIENHTHLTTYTPSSNILYIISPYSLSLNTQYYYIPISSIQNIVNINSSPPYNNNEYIIPGLLINEIQKTSPNVIGNLGVQYLSLFNQATGNLIFTSNIFNDILSYTTPGGYFLLSYESVYLFTSYNPTLISYNSDLTYIFNINYTSNVYTNDSIILTNNVFYQTTFDNTSMINIEYNDLSNILTLNSQYSINQLIMNNPILLSLNINTQLNDPLLLNSNIVISLGNSFDYTTSNYIIPITLYNNIFINTPLDSVNNGVYNIYTSTIINLFNINANILSSEQPFSILKYNPSSTVIIDFSVLSYVLTYNNALNYNINIPLFSINSNITTFTYNDILQDNICYKPVNTDGILFNSNVNNNDPYERMILYFTTGTSQLLTNINNYLLNLPVTNTNGFLPSFDIYQSVYLTEFQSVINEIISKNVLYNSNQPNIQVIQYTFDQNNINYSNLINTNISIDLQIEPVYGLNFKNSGSNYATKFYTFEFALKCYDNNNCNLLNIDITHKDITLNSPSLQYYYNYSNSPLFLNNTTAQISFKSGYDIYNDASSFTVITNINNPTITTELISSQNTHISLYNIQRIEVYTDLFSPSNLHNLYDYTTYYYESNITSGDLNMYYNVENLFTQINFFNFKITAVPNLLIEADINLENHNISLGKNLDIIGVNNICLGNTFNITGDNSIILGNYVGSLKNIIYGSILLGNNSFGTQNITNTIAIGNYILENIQTTLDNYTLQTRFFAQQPVLIGNSISSFEYIINVNNVFLYTTEKIGTETSNVKKVYLGNNNEQVLIGYTSNVDASSNVYPSLLSGISSLLINGTTQTNNLVVEQTTILAGNTYIHNELKTQGPYLTPSSSNYTTILLWLTNLINTYYGFDDQPPFWCSFSKNLYYDQYNISSNIVERHPYYSGGVLIPDGRVVFTPFFSQSIGIFNPYTSSFTAITNNINNTNTTVPSANGDYNGSVLLPNGTVLFIPFNSTNVGLFNPITNNFTINTNLKTFDTTYTHGIYSATGASFYGGVLLPNGMVLFIPYNSTRLVVYDPNNHILNDITTAADATNPLLSSGIYGKYSGGVLLPDGRILFVPTSTTNNIANIVLFELTDPVTLKYTLTQKLQITIQNPNPNNFAQNQNDVSDLFKGGVLLQNGNVLFVPYNAKSIGIYDPINNIYNPITNNQTIYLPYQAFSGGISLPDGRVIFSPFEMPSILIYDLTNNQITIPYATLQLNGLNYTYVANTQQITPSGNGDYNSGVLLFDGRIVLIPMYAKNIGIIYGNNLPPPKEFCLHPFYNKF